MSTEIERFKKEALLVWSDSEKIRQLFAPNLSTDEFSLYMSMGMELGANPFKREIWAIKFGQAPAQIFCARDLYRRVAQEQVDFEGIQVDAVYENDKFSVNNGKVIHEYQLKNRGNLVGAYCITYRKGVLPYYVFVELSEYYLGNKNIDGSVKKRKDFKTQSWIDMQPTNWDTKPATMIKKVAEAQSTRGAFSGKLGNTYGEAEQWEDADVVQDQKKELLKPSEPLGISQEQMDRSMAAISEKPIDVLKWLNDRAKTPEQEIEIEDAVNSAIKELSYDPEKFELIEKIGELYPVNIDVIISCGLTIENGKVKQAF